MKLNQIAYHWTDDYRIDSILEEGLNPLGGLLMTGVYMDLNPEDLFGKKIVGNSLLAVHLRGLEDKLFYVPEKKWVVCEERVPITNIYHVGTDFEDEIEIRQNVSDIKKNLQKYFRRASMPVDYKKISQLR